MSETSRTARAPHAEKRLHQTTTHGVTREDPYAWLRADNWQEVMRDPSVLSSDIRDHLKAENDYTAATLSDTEDLQTDPVRRDEGPDQAG